LTNHVIAIKKGKYSIAKHKGKKCEFRNANRTDLGKGGGALQFYNSTETHYNTF